MLVPPPGPSYTLDEIASLTGGLLIGDGSIRVHGVEPLVSATPGALAFVRGVINLPDLFRGRASAVLLPKDVDARRVQDEDPLHRSIVVVADVELALIAVLGAFERKVQFKSGVHPTAFVDPSATVSPEASVGPGCVISAGATVESGAVLIGQCWLGCEARVGQKSVIHPGVRVLDRCRVGNHCIIHSGTVIGADGFGFHPSPDGRGLIKVPHVGDVVIEDHVEIGANSCVDRAKFGSTIIGAGTKIDNLVQIGHNTRIGRSCIICGQSGVAGSVDVGDGVMIGGGVGISDNLTIGAGAKVGAGSGVGNSIAPGESYFGYPAEPASQWRRNYSAYRTLGRMLPQIRRYMKTFDNPI